ncbi:hypothetical protein ACFVWN_01455 [Nocardiopsis flavescens]|uniref:hypothetical protein n=1 Tax=Nocardiopsis flavescens TaxID=758803 RepID=UPI0036678AC9
MGFVGGPWGERRHPVEVGVGGVVPRVYQVVAPDVPPPAGSGRLQVHEYEWDPARERYLHRGLWEPEGSLDELMALLPDLGEES